MVVELHPQTKLDLPKDKKNGCKELFPLVIKSWARRGLDLLWKSPETPRYDDNLPPAKIVGKVAFGPEGKPTFPDHHHF